MTDLSLIKDVTAIIGSTIAIIAVLVTAFVWSMKRAIKKGEGYQLFKSLVEEVKSMSKVMDKEFVKNNREHDGFKADYREIKEEVKEHDIRINTLEVKTDGKKA